MKKIISFILIISILTSCSTVSYSPKVTLDISPRTIDKKIEIKKFEDKTNYKTKKSPFLGINLVNSKSLSGELDLEITNAVVYDFQINQLFNETNRRIEDPDYILKGSILKYNVISKPNTFFKISFFGGIILYTIGFAEFLATENPVWLLLTLPYFSPFFGFKVQDNIVEIEMEFKIYNGKNELLKEYTIIKNLKESSSIYHSNVLALQSQANKTLSDVVLELRENILKDF